MIGETVSFTFEWYESLLERLTGRGYKFRGYDTEPSDGEVILRHDVDWSPRKARKMAAIERDAGVTGTYFFFVSTPFYNVLHDEVREIIKHIERYGHRVGLHFSPHNYFEDEPRDELLTEKVQTEFEVLGVCRQGSEQVLSFHNPPEWVLERSYKGFTSAYEPRFFSEVSYQADSNQRWKGDEPFQGELPDTMQILTHPVLWGERDAWSVDRLREERDYHDALIEDFMDETDMNWANYELQKYE